MLELADAVVLNKSDRRGAADALRDVRKQWRRNHAPCDASDAELPVFPTVARRWNDPGSIALYQALRPRLVAAQAPRRGACAQRSRPRAGAAARRRELIPSGARPLSRRDRRGGARLPRAQRATGRARRRRLEASRARCALLGDPPPPGAGAFAAPPLRGRRRRRALRAALRRGARRARSGAAPRRSRVAGHARALPQPRRRATRCAGATIRVANHAETLARTPLPKVALPSSESWGELTRYLRAREPARPLPVHGRRVPVQARERGPDAHVRGRGDARAHQPALPPAVAPGSPPRGSRPPSTARRSTAATRIRASTSGARSATPACRSARSTTRRSSTRASTCAIRRRPSR